MKPTDMEHKEELELRFTNTRPRELGPDESAYPTYRFKTIQEVFDALTPDNMEGFFKDFKLAVSATIHTREMIYIVAREKAQAAGKDPDSISRPDVLTIKHFDWIDDQEPIKENNI